MSFKATEEQVKAVELTNEYRTLKLSALAGAAKTSTCTLVAEANPVQSLYLAFNKTMADDAKGRFPDHVEVRTTHSLAYRVFGRKYAHKLTRPSGGYQNVAWTGSEVARKFNIPSGFIPTTGKVITAPSIGACVIATLARFEQSADEVITKKHVTLSGIPEKKRGSVGFPSDSLQNKVMEYAQRLWRERIDVDNPTMITHDTYLKLYQLSNPDLSDYKIIYLDEYQDTNECVHAIAMSQTTSTLVAVGDRYQAIYGWRGAVNMMDKLPWPEGGLTKSFRFGQKLADLANEILRDQKTLEYRTEMLGFEERETEVLCGMEWREKSNQCSQYTKLYRTNSNLIADAIEDISAGKKVALQVNTGDFIRCLQSGVALRQGKKASVKHDMFLGFDNWKEFEEESVSNHEYARIFRMLVEGDVPRIIATLENYKQPKKHDILYSTAHKAKGLEWDVVVLAEDFPSPLNKEGSWVGFTQEEQNLLYVAATRAKKVLVKNSSIEEMLLHYNSKKEILEDCATLGITVRGVGILSPDHLSPGDLERTLDTILGSDKELEAVESMQDDEIYPDGVDCGLTTRFSGMYNDSKLMPSFTGYVTRPIPALSLEKQIELTMASEFGYIMTDLDRFVEGPVPDQNNDEACDKNHWSRAGAEQWHTPYED